MLFQLVALFFLCGVDFKGSQCCKKNLPLVEFDY